MFGKTCTTFLIVLAYMMVWPACAVYAVSDPPANFLVAVTNMMSLPNLAYEENHVDRRHNASSSYVERKYSQGKTYYRSRSNDAEFLNKETVSLYDGDAYYTLFGDVALKSDEDKPGFPGLPAVKQLAAAQNALPVPDEFQGVACWRYEWLCETVVTRFTGGELNIDPMTAIRNDFVDQATGWWIGYTMTNTEGPFESSVRLDLIRTNELSADLFTTPKPPIRIRPHTTEIYQEEVKKRMAALGMLKQPALNLAERDGLLGMLSQRYHLPLNRILFCVSLGAVVGLLTWLFLELRRKKRT